MSAAALGEEGIRGDGFCYPGVATDGTAGSYYCFAAQNRGVCVDCNIIFYSRVPFFVHELFFYAKGTKGYALVDFYVVADYAGFAYYNTSSVVNKETFANFCAWVYVYSGLTMGMFTHDAGDDGDSGLAEEVGYAVGCDGFQAGVGNNYLFRGLCGRVANVGSLNVKAYLAAQLWNFFY